MSDIRTGNIRRGLKIGVVGLMALAAMVGVVKTVTFPLHVRHDQEVPSLQLPSKRRTLQEPKCFETTEELRLAVDQYMVNRGQNTNVATTYGWPIGVWCVSNIQDFSNLFSYYRNPAFARFNDDIGDWDTSSATNMKSMFQGDWIKRNYIFNRDISGWDVSKVTDMGNMFYGAYFFNQNLGPWDVSSVRNMQWMFAKTNAFNQDLSMWNVASATNMRSMFYYAKAFNQDISSWQVSSVTNMQHMFLHADIFNQNLAPWDVSRVTDMQYMFNHALSFSQNLCEWGPKLPSTTRVEWMFRYTRCPKNGMMDDPVLTASPRGPFCHACA